VCNVLLLALVGWALVDQYPHPSESGFIEYVIALVLGPFVSAVALFRSLSIRPSSAA